MPIDTPLQKDLLLTKMRKLFPLTAGYMRLDDGESFSIWKNKQPMIYLSFKTMDLTVNRTLSIQEAEKLLVIKDLFPEITFIPKNKEPNIPLMAITDINGNNPVNRQRQ